MKLNDNMIFTFWERKIMFAIANKAEKRWKKMFQKKGENQPHAPMFRCQFESCESCPMDMECWHNVERMLQIIKLNCILRNCVYGFDVPGGIDEELPSEFE